jgi:hypothetical protein
MTDEKMDRTSDGTSIDRDTSSEAEVLSAIRKAVADGTSLTIMANGKPSMQIAARRPLRDLDDETPRDGFVEVREVDLDTVKTLLGLDPVQHGIRHVIEQLAQRSSGHGIRMGCYCEQCTSIKRDMADANRWRTMFPEQPPNDGTWMTPERMAANAKASALSEEAPPVGRGPCSSNPTSDDVSPARLISIASNAGGERATRDEQRSMARELIILRRQRSDNPTRSAWDIRKAALEEARVVAQGNGAGVTAGALEIMIIREERKVSESPVDYPISETVPVAEYKRVLAQRDELAAGVIRDARAPSGQPDELAPLRERMAKGRKKYPNGCTALSLLDEVGEVAHALNKYEPSDRVRDEILDVANVAMRLYLGEIDRGLTIDGLEQRRTDGDPSDSGKVKP